MNLERLLPSLLVRDIEESLAFYVNRLGFTQTAAHPSDAPPTWVEVARDSIVLQLYSEPPIGMPDQPLMSGTLYCVTDGVLALAAEFQAKGVDFEWGPEVMGYGMREFGLRDPNGYTLAFTETA